MGIGEWLTCAYTFRHGELNGDDFDRDHPRRWIVWRSLVLCDKEHEQHIRNSYSALKYGLVHALGFGGLLCFAFAYNALAVRVGWALIYTSPSN
jgi:hypothetical protein